MRSMVEGTAADATPVFRPLYRLRRSPSTASRRRNQLLAPYSQTIRSPAMLIPCPICGLRDHGEFTYGGDATVVRPAIDDSDPHRWAAYVYDRRNPRGPHTEYWHHVHGCRSWMIVERNTETHEVGAARLIGAFAPSSDNGAG